MLWWWNCCDAVGASTFAWLTVIRLQKTIAKHRVCNNTGKYIIFFLHSNIYCDTQIFIMRINWEHELLLAHTSKATENRNVHQYLSESSPIPGVRTLGLLTLLLASKFVFKHFFNTFHLHIFNVVYDIELVTSHFFIICCSSHVSLMQIIYSYKWSPLTSVIMSNCRLISPFLLSRVSVAFFVYFDIFEKKIAKKPFWHNKHNETIMCFLSTRLFVGNEHRNVACIA